MDYQLALSRQDVLVKVFKWKQIRQSLQLTIYGSVDAMHCSVYSLNFEFSRPLFFKIG